MGGKRNTGRLDAGRRVAELAQLQHGVVARRQLRTLGLSDEAISHAEAVGRLHRVLRGVYAVGLPASGQRPRAMAAVLACGAGAVASHLSAAALLGLVDRGPVVVDVIAPGQRGRKIDGVRVHKVAAPLPQEAGTVDGIPCTSPGRTLADLAGVVGVRTLRSAFERAAARRMLDLEAVEAARRPHQRGGPALRALADEWRAAAPIASTLRLKSPLEAMVLPLLARRGLPAPRANAPVRLVPKWIEVDFLWADERFVLEADSRDFHGTEVAFERDRWRDRELMRVGFSTLRVTRLQAESEADAVAAAIEERLRPRRRRGAGG
jgi:predicted transcriptional regulator of viral defense system/very-short-patch-repair endonuclease